MATDTDKGHVLTIQPSILDQSQAEGSVANTPNKKGGGFFKTKTLYGTTINEKTFVTGLNNLPRNKYDDSNRMAEIQTYYGKINDVLQVLDQKVGNLVKQHENDFLFAYKDQMHNVQKELKALKKKIDEETLKRRSDERMNILEEERDWFRAEAIRLDKICKEQQKLVNEFKFKIKIMNEDRTYYEDYILGAKKENKALKEELLHTDNNNSQKGDSYSKKLVYRNERLQNSVSSEDKRTWSPKQLKKTNSQGGRRKSQTNENISNENIDNHINSQDFELPIEHRLNQYPLDPVKPANAESIEKYIEIINDLKSELDKEKKLVRQLKSQKANIIIHRTELEQILIDSINEIKKDICKRKSMLNLKELNKCPILPEEINFSKFSSTDKKRVVEYFLSNEYVLEELYHMVFGQNHNSNTIGMQQVSANNSSINVEIKPTHYIQKSQSQNRIIISDSKLKYSFNYGFDAINSKFSKKELMAAGVNGFNNKSKGLLEQIRKPI